MLTVSAAAETVTAWALASSALLEIWMLVADNCSAAAASECEAVPSARTVDCMLPEARLSAWAITPTSSRERIATVPVRSPSATRISISETCPSAGGRSGGPVTIPGDQSGNVTTVGVPATHVTVIRIRLAPSLKTITAATAGPSVTFCTR
jgi:hypothetical protein